MAHMSLHTLYYWVYSWWKWISILTLSARESNLPFTTTHICLEEFSTDQRLAPCLPTSYTLHRPCNSCGGITGPVHPTCPAFGSAPSHCAMRKVSTGSRAHRQDSQQHPDCARTTAPQLSVLHEPGSTCRLPSATLLDYRRHPAEGKSEGGRQKSPPIAMRTSCFCQFPRNLWPWELIGRDQCTFRPRS